MADNFMIDPFVSMLSGSSSAPLGPLDEWVKRTGSENVTTAITPSIKAAAEKFISSPEYKAQHDKTLADLQLRQGVSGVLKSGEQEQSSLQPIVDAAVNPFVIARSRDSGDPNFMLTKWRDGTVTREYLEPDSDGAWDFWFPTITKAALAAMSAYVGGGLTGLIEAGAAGAGTAGVAEAGMGAGEMATYGMGGSGLSGTAAMEAGTGLGALSGYGAGEEAAAALTAGESGGGLATIGGSSTGGAGLAGGNLAGASTFPVNQSLALGGTGLAGTGAAAAAGGGAATAGGGLTMGNALQAASLLSSIGGSLLSADASRSAANTAADAQINAGKDATALQKYMYDKNVALNQPFYDSGLSALPMLQSAITGQPVNGVSYDYTQSPVAKYALQTGGRELMRGLGARGLAGSGLAPSKMAELTSQIYANDYDKQIGRLAGLVDMARGTSSNLSNLGQNYANNASNITINSGDAAANAALANGRTQASLYSGMGQIPMNLATLYTMSGGKFN